MLLLALQALEGAAPTDSEYSDFVDNLIIKVIGPSSFLSGLCAYMGQRNFPGPIYHVSLMQLLGSILSTHHFSAHLYPSGFLTAMKTMIVFYASSNDPKHCYAMGSALELLTWVLLVSVLYACA